MNICYDKAWNGLVIVAGEHVYITQYLEAVSQMCLAKFCVGFKDISLRYSLYSFILD